MGNEDNFSNSKPKWHWLAWWEVDDREIDPQVEGYRTLGWLKAARKLSALMLIGSAVVTVLLFGDVHALMTTLPDAIVMLILAMFIFAGKKWAMIAAMLLWTLDKGFGIYDIFIQGKFNTGFIGQIIWWCVYMHAFYLAFKVEQRRREIDLAGVFS